MKRGVVSFVAVFAVIWCTVSSVTAGEFPTKTIMVIVNVSVGGSNDIQARAFASVAGRILKQPVIVINKPGASGMLGLIQGAEAAPDGYTLTTSSMSEMCLLESEKVNNRKVDVSLNDFVSIGAFTVSPLIIGVPANSPWKTIEDLIRDAKANRGKYTYASGGLYRIAHINSELFAKAVGVKFRHVPYGGGAQAVTSVVEGYEDFAAMTPSSSIPLFKGGKLRALAVHGDMRSKFLPDVPTLKEKGIDASVPQIVGLGVPKKTPTPIVEKLRLVLKQVAEDKAFMSAIESQGDAVHYVTGEEFAKVVERESKKVAQLFKQLIQEKK